jgi:hypothetical protein
MALPQQQPVASAHAFLGTSALWLVCNCIMMHWLWNNFACSLHVRVAHTFMGSLESWVASCAGAKLPLQKTLYVAIQVTAAREGSTMTQKW